MRQRSDKRSSFIFTFFVLQILVAALGWSACSPHNERGSGNAVRVKPLSASDKARLREQFMAGKPVGPDSPAVAASLNENAGTSESDCRQFIQKLDSSWSHDYIEVPEDWSRPDGQKIKVFYYHMPIGSNDTPVVFFNGGPAGDSHGSSYALVPTWRATADALQVSSVPPAVFIDQRGTGCSTPFPDDIKRLQHYTSRSIVADAEAIRARLLGARQWKAFGQSYGGLIVYRYAALAPQSLAGAYAHGYSVMADSVQWLAMRVASTARVWKDYVREFPDDEKRHLALREYLTRDRCFTDGEHKACGPAILDAAIYLLGFRSNWPTLNQWLTVMVPEPGVVSEQAVALFARAFTFGLFAQRAAAEGVITIIEITPGLNDSTGCRLAEKKLAEQGVDVEALPFNECRLVREMKLATFEVPAAFKVDPIDVSKLRSILKDNPKLPFFLYSGKSDVFVPIESFVEPVRILGDTVTYREFATSGHEGFMTEPQVLLDIVFGRSDER